MALIFPPLCRDEDGLQAELVDTITPGSTEYMGMWVSPLGALQCTLDAPLYYQNGLPFNAGRMCISNHAIAYVQDAVPFSATGAVVIIGGDASSVSYIEQGVPFSAGGAIVSDVLSAGPEAPTWGAMPVLSHFEWELKQEFSVAGYVYTNGASGPITDYRLVTPPAGFTIDSAGLVTCAAGTAPGDYTLTIEALNSVDWSTALPGQLRWEIKVGVVPTWGTIPDKTTQETSLPQNYNVVPYVSSPDTPVTAYTLESAPAGFTIPDPAVGVIHASDPIIAVHPIQVAATSLAGKSLPASFNWEITLGSSVPVWTNVGEVFFSTADYPFTYDLSPFVSSPNEPVDGPPTDFQLQNSPAAFTIDPNTGVVSVAETVAPGSHTIYASAANNVGRGYSQAIVFTLTTVPEWYIDFTTGYLGPFLLYRNGQGSTNDYDGAVVTVDDNEPLFPGARDTNGSGWVDEGVTYGLRIEPARTNLATGNTASAGEWTAVGGTVVGGFISQEGIGGISFTDDGAPGRHYVYASTDTTGVPVPQNYAASCYIERNWDETDGTGQRYVAFAIEMPAQANDWSVWAVIDTKTWTVVGGGQDSANNPGHKLYVAHCEPLADGLAARVAIEGQNNTGATQDFRLILAGVTAHDSDWRESYQGTGIEVCKWYGTQLEYEDDDKSQYTGWIPKGETRGKAFAQYFFPQTPGPRDDYFAAQVVFRSPNRFSNTVTGARIWGIATDPNDPTPEVGGGISIREQYGGLVQVNFTIDLDIKHTASIDMSGARYGRAVDIRMLKNPTGFYVWAMAPTVDYDPGDDPDNPADPHLDFQEFVYQSVDTQNPFPKDLARVQLGANDGQSEETALVDIISVRFGFDTGYTKEQILDWPRWQEPGPIVLSSPDDVEVPLA